jgi:hypothetical protein
MKKKSGMAGDAFDFTNVDDLLGGGRPKSGAPMRTQSIDDLLGGTGTASGGSSGPGSAVGVGVGVGGGGVVGGGGGAAGDDDLLGALFGETTTTTSRTASGSKLGGMGAPASTSGGGMAASSANDLLDGADDFFSGGVASGVASAKDSPASAGSGLDELDLSGVMDEGEPPTIVEDTTARGYDRGRSAVEDASEIEPAIPEPTPTPSTTAAAADDGLAGFEDFFSPGRSAATSSGAAASGGGGGLDSLEDLLKASTAGGGGKGKKGGGMSLGSDTMDDLFGAHTAPAHPSGGGVPAAAVIDDMFGAMMGGGRTNAAPATASAEAFSYAPDSDDEDREGDTLERKEARRRRHERVKSAKLQEKRDREARALADQAERQMLKDMIGADIDEWLRVNQNNVRTMLANLGDVLWRNHGYKSPSMNDLLHPPSVKKCYHRALILIHPDKVRQRGGDTSMIYIADKVFDQVRDAYKTFEAKEM